MRERPILFSGAMVRALLDGRKTQTRRLVKHDIDDLYNPSASCPYGQPCDRLWVRETWAHVPASAYRCSDGVQQTVCPSDSEMAAVYAADWDRSRPGRWRPSIHMPRWASRITLEVTGVRVERLQDISEADAQREGCGATVDYSKGRGYREEFRDLWESINGSGGWDANPWVWVVEFARMPA